MTREQLSNIFLQPTVAELKQENRSLRKRNRLAYVGLIGLTALSMLVGNYAYRTTSRLNKANQENESLRENISFFQADAIKLSKQNCNLKRYAEDAQILADSMQFYPDMPDSITSLPEEEQEKAGKEFEAINQKKQNEHNKALKTLGVDTNLLFRVQKGPHLVD